MADQGLWFKLWCAALDDPQLDNLPVDDFGRWAKLGTFLKRHGRAGEVRIEAPARLLCAAFQVPDFAALVATFQRLPGVIMRSANGSVPAGTTVYVSFLNWAKYQGDLSTPRTRRFRTRERSRGEERRGEENKKRISPLKVPPAKVEVFEKLQPPTGFKIDPVILEALDRLKLFRPIPRFRDPDWWQSMILAFPRIDHLEAMSEAHGYLLNSKKRYTDLPAFVRNSFKRAQEEADR